MEACYLEGVDDAQVVCVVLSHAKIAIQNVTTEQMEEDTSSYQVGR
jgi:hypothetical protein